MVTQGSTVSLNKAALDVFREAHDRMQNPVAAKRLWQRLSPAQQRELGTDEIVASFKMGVVSMWLKLHDVGVDRAVIEAARFLNFLDHATYEWLLREIGEFADDPDDLEHVFPFADLVIIENLRKAYWLAQEIPVNWNKYSRPWEYLVILATQSRAGKTVDRFDFSEQLADDYMVKMKSRLGELKGFPLDLASRIERESPGSQRLAIPRDRIRIFYAKTQTVLVSKP